MLAWIGFLPADDSSSITGHTLHVDGGILMAESNVMKIAHYSEKASELQQNGPRQGRFEFWRLFEGEVGSPDNFLFRITRLDSGFYSPRHCHNFDQIRFILEGETDFSRDGKLKAGMIGYFPEGTAYGPQTTSDDMLVLTLQFGGASGQGYLSADQLERAGSELKAAGGRFEKGMFITIDADGREQRKDGYQALWEHVNGVPFRAPRRRYRQPIMIDPESFAWRPSTSDPNVSHRHLGSFTECVTQLDLFRVAAGASLQLQPHSLYFVVSGRGEVGAEAVDRFSAVRLNFEEFAELRAIDEANVLRIGLPDLRGVEPPAARELAAAGR